MNTLSRKKIEQLLRNVRGTYTHTEWAVVNDEGEVLPKSEIFGGAWIVMDNAYDYVILRVERDCTLARYELEEEA